MKAPKILAIVVNWNKRDLLNAMLTSLKESPPPPNCDIVVVDNASTDDSVAMLRELHPYCDVIELPVNSGGTGGFNAGMEYGLRHPNGYDYLWLMDNDILVHPHAGQVLVDILEERTDVGLIGSTVLVMGDPGHVQQCGIRVRWGTGALKNCYEGRLEDLTRPKLFESDFVSACSLMARVEAVRQVGLWDPAYFVFWDDVEWGIRFQRAGWRVVATTASLVEHESWQDRRGRSAVIPLYQNFRNAFYLFWKYCPEKKRPKLLYRYFRSALALSDNYNTTGQYEEARALQLAVRDFFAGRMGSPPWSELTAPVPAPPSIPQPERLTGIRRVALLVTNNAEATRTMHAMLSDKFGTEVDSILLNSTPEMLREDLPRRQLHDISRYVQRVKLAFTLARTYDAVASPAFQQPYLFERLVKYRLRIHEDLKMDIIPRKPLELIVLALSRTAVVPRAALLAIRALFRRRVAIDYHAGIR